MVLLRKQSYAIKSQEKAGNAPYWLLEHFLPKLVLYDIRIGGFHARKAHNRVSFRAKKESIRGVKIDSCEAIVQ